MAATAAGVSFRIARLRSASPVSQVAKPSGWLPRVSVRVPTGNVAAANEVAAVAPQGLVVQLVIDRGQVRPRAGDARPRPVGGQDEDPALDLDRPRPEEVGPLPAVAAPAIV
ncbi:MAG: hypothetical protein JO329_19815 [Planctomycetaceae bacterium]|nr:hypothetical protein [Planctomycetaceae bacterium]